ncbi:MAG TPA: ABC transporter permease [Steroidobacteraceae bacterium]|nr:ABC transporter permease [Steroidobacteraceae bacterium]
MAILVMLLASLCAKWMAPFDPVAIDFGAMLTRPSGAHLFGTDQFGRDVLSRIIYGARTALLVGFWSSFLGCTAGTIIGIASAYFGGRVDLLLQRFTDVLLSFPIIVLALLVGVMLGSKHVAGVDLNLILAIALPMLPRAVRVIRAAALTVREMPYIDAARAAGYSHCRIMFRHMAPNVIAPYLIIITAFIAQAILLEASLTFLGLGVAEPTPAWGLMLSGTSSDFYREAPWMIVFPGVAISVSVFAFNLFGDSLRDWLDPKFRV